jgi:hypothetical protein
LARQHEGVAFRTELEAIQNHFDGLHNFTRAAFADASQVASGGWLKLQDV